MKTSSITAAALLVSAAELVFAAPSTSCKPDECLNALKTLQVAGPGKGAKAFCDKFLLNHKYQNHLPKNILNSCRDASGYTKLRISSACACLTPEPRSGSDAAAAATAGPKSSDPKHVGGSKGGHPCAQISDAWSKQKKTTDTPVVPAALAYDCLKSVPLGKQQAIELVDAIAPYLNWQSDAADKKNPPKDYAYPGFDMFANLAAVRNNLQAGKYSGEYDFQVDLYKQVWAPGQDGHFVFYPDLLAKAFKWKRQSPPLVSISEDGQSLPVIKLQSDVIANAKTAPVVTKINDIDAAKYLEDTVNSASYLQDADAAYNTMFWSKATAASLNSGGFVAGGRHAMFYHGPTTTLTFSNGTTVQLENQATVIGDMSGVVDGPSMYKKFCTPGAASDSPEPASGNSTLTGYPQPEVSTQDGTVTGYYLAGQGLSDVAVLTLKSFKPDSPAEFQAVITDFLSGAKDAGKKKLVVDLQNNGGGLILLGYDFFRQLFPKTVQDGNSRWKLTKTMSMAAGVISETVKHLNSGQDDDNDLITLAEIWLNYRHDMNTSNQNFLTLQDKFSPHVYKNTQYTNLMRYNLSDTLLTSDPVHGLGIDITGYGSLTERPQYFAPEDIILLYDGACSSTCTVVSEFLRLLGGVKSIAMGGRPKPGPIQGVGGVKGGQSLDYASLHSYLASVSELTTDSAIKAEMDRYSTLPIERSTVASLNVRDVILQKNMNDGVPAQFVYEAADCRLYWTAPMISDVTEVWKAAANAAFNGAKCANGGIAGSKPGRRSESAPVSRRGPAPARLADKVDKTPVTNTHSLKWKAKHIQEAIR
ncbi:hypothetical protein E4U43_002083 [Claviceps pusilla]|uniref:Tail specific protease domain-containing protein n=1 Tax=Claviceps pusilla TaxID=123648 RepID=A0A9P7SWD4_9HYPO|nr:hypothetical protein E4U43_002083 [Claviceps pusilla]